MTTTPTPMKPWKATKKERATDISIFFLALLSSYAVVAVTPMKGKLAIFVVFFLVYMLMTSSIKGFQLGSAAAKDATTNPSISQPLFVIASDTTAMQPAIKSKPSRFGGIQLLPSK